MLLTRLNPTWTKNLNWNWIKLIPNSSLERKVAFIKIYRPRRRAPIISTSWEWLSRTNTTWSDITTPRCLITALKVVLSSSHSSMSSQRILTQFLIKRTISWSAVLLNSVFSPIKLDRTQPISTSQPELGATLLISKIHANHSKQDKTLLSALRLTISISISEKDTWSQCRIPLNSISWLLLTSKSSLLRSTLMLRQMILITMLWEDTSTMTV